MGKETGRGRMIECMGYTSEDRSLRRWGEIRSVRRVLRNYIVLVFCRMLPDVEFKNRLLRRIGMKIGKDVSILGSNLDVFFPELIEIGDRSMIGNHTTLLTHEFLSDGWRKGPVKIGKDVTVGTMCLVMPGVSIGDGAVVAAYSLVNRDVEPGTLSGGVPVKLIRKL